MRLLVIAPGASSQDVGEVFVAYRIAEELTNFFEVTLITLERIGKPSEINDSKFEKVIRFKETPGFHKFERFNSMAKPWYLTFFFQARSWLKNSLENGETFDWAYQINPFAIRYPSPLYGLGIPYSLGPVAGGLPTLNAFKKQVSSAPWYVRLRGFDEYLHYVIPGLERSYQDARIIFVAASYVKEIVQRRFYIPDHKITVLNELGVFEVHDKCFDQSEPTVIRLLYVGRVVRTKGARDLIKAISLLKGRDKVHLDIIGDGEDLLACKQLAHDLNLDETISFHGRLDRLAVNAFYQNADIFTFPSFREPTGGVLVEAMSFGLPMIVADFGGPQSIVDSNFGLKINPQDLNQFSHGIADAIDTLVENQSMRESFSKHASDHCRSNYIWKNKIAVMAERIKQEVGK